MRVGWIRMPMWAIARRHIQIRAVMLTIPTWYTCIIGIWEYIQMILFIQICMDCHNCVYPMLVDQGRIMPFLILPIQRTLVAVVSQLYGMRKQEEDCPAQRPLVLRGQLLLL